MNSRRYTTRRHTFIILTRILTSRPSNSLDMQSLWRVHWKTQKKIPVHKAHPIPLIGEIQLQAKPALARQMLKSSIANFMMRSWMAYTKQWQQKVNLSTKKFSSVSIAMQTMINNRSKAKNKENINWKDSLKATIWT
jgi:hypothetical protein